MRDITVDKLNFKKLELIKAIWVEIETDNGLYVVWSEELWEWGSGKTLSDAIEDFGISLEDIYFELKANQNKLGKFMEKVWNYMQTIIKEK